jgi:hypothetical protein
MIGAKLTDQDAATLSVIVDISVTKKGNVNSQSRTDKFFDCFSEKQRKFANSSRAPYKNCDQWSFSLRNATVSR